MHSSLRYKFFRVYYAQCLRNRGKTAGVAVKKKKRADSKDVAGIALEDLAKYFDLPMVEASRNLNVGITVLKRKCREFGIPRWPHRKIKSLDSLIRDLQVLSLSFLLSNCLKNNFEGREYNNTTCWS